MAVNLPPPQNTNPAPSDVAAPPPQDCPIVSDYTINNNRWEIRVSKGDGSHMHDITDPAFDNKSPVLAPDCQRVVFTSDRDGHWEIYSMYADGGNQHRLTAGQSDAIGPWWTGDGRIVYVVDNNGVNETHIMNADGSGDQVIGQ